MCDLEKQAISKQIYFKCYESTTLHESLPTPATKQNQNKLINTRIQVDSNLINVHLKTYNKLVFLIIENDNLFPSHTQQKSLDNNNC